VLVWTIVGRRCLTWSATYADHVPSGQWPSDPRRHVHRVVRHPSAPLVVFTVAGAVVVVGTVLPWFRAGSTSRSSYQLMGLLTRLEIAPDGLVSDLVRWWPVVPLLVTTAVVLAWWRWTIPALVIAAIALVYVGGVGYAIVDAARDVGVTTGPGPWVCTLGGIDLLASSVWLALSTSSRRLALPAPAAAPLADPS
jgi:hypothetical protein